jgi:glycosyltransferase involved in cell wall biosynthesis
VRVEKSHTICLNMIVKNEAPVIRRCIESVRPLIDSWVIVDTGSTDGTQDIIRAELHDIPGTLHERPWRNFAHNRSEALELAQASADYSMIIDADDYLELASTDALTLTHDCYSLVIRDPPLSYPRKQLVNNRQKWFYRGVLHEFLECNEPHTSGNLDLAIRRNHDGARRRAPGTYGRDAALLLDALRTESDPFLVRRYTFYLAQSFRDAGRLDLAIARYLQRAGQGGWEEEIFISLYQVAKLKQRMGHDSSEVIAAFEAADAVTRTRAEALHGAARQCRIDARHADGFAFAKRGLERPQPDGSLFVEPWIYQYGLLDEYAVTGSWLGQYAESREACMKILASGSLPSDQLSRVVGNAKLCFKLGLMDKA